jgi:hypothetical protein
MTNVPRKKRIADHTVVANVGKAPHSGPHGVGSGRGATGGRSQPVGSKRFYPKRKG